MIDYLKSHANLLKLSWRIKNHCKQELNFFTKKTCKLFCLKTQAQKHAFKLCMSCINWFSQQARWPKGQNKMCIGGKKLHFILSDYSFKGIKPELNYLINFFRFLVWCGLYSPTSLFIACNKRYNLCMNCAWIGRVSWSSTTLNNAVFGKNYWKCEKP